MDVKSVIQIDYESSPLPIRLGLARRKAGLSLRGLADLTSVSHVTVSQYEKGQSYPSDPVIRELCKALGVTKEYLTEQRQSSLRLGEIEFRKRARTTAADRTEISRDLIYLLERYQEVEDLLEIDEQWNPPSLQASSPNDTHAYAEEMAAALREHWKLGQTPIGDMTKLLEEQGIKVLVPRGSLDISGLTCEVHREGRSSVFVVVVNKEHSLERRRFTLAHELAHRLLNFEGVNGKMAESLCNTFAGAFLVPAETLRHEMSPLPHVPVYQEIILAKRFFRVSAAMLLMRLEQIGCIELWQRDNIFKTFGKTWRATEPEPLEMASPDRYGRQEMPRFERLVYQALAKEFITPEAAVRLLGVTLWEVERGLRGPEYGLS